MNYCADWLVYVAIYLIAVLGLNIVAGYGGLLTLAHAGYFAIGAYAYAVATLTLGWGFFPSLGLAMVASLILSLAISIPAWKFRGDFFVIMSLAVQSLVSSAAYCWYNPASRLGTLTNMTNGPSGISGIPRPELCGLVLSSSCEFAALTAGVSCLCVAFYYLLLSSPWGRLLACVRDDEMVARGLGKNTRLMKVQAFAVASIMVAVSGALYAAYMQVIDPQNVTSLNMSIEMLCIAIVGGLGGLAGPFAGVTLLVVQQALRFVPVLREYAGDINLMVYGLLLVLLMRFRPQGILGKYRLE